jgi:putative redox protein
LSFPNGRGETLAGRLDLPRDGRPRAWALLAHCFTCTKDLKALYHLGGALAEAGVASLRVDFAGLGESEGRSEETDLTSNVGDLVAAAGYLRTVGGDPALLVGHSLGGTACLLAARELPSVKAVATVGTAADPLHLARLLPAARKTAEEAGTVLVQIGPQNVRVSDRLFRELEGLDGESLVRGLGRPLLVVHAAADEVVPVEQGERIFGWARHPKAFVSLARADHVLSNASDAGSLGTLIAAWAAPYLPG